MMVMQDAAFQFLLKAFQGSLKNIGEENILNFSKQEILQSITHDSYTMRVCWRGRKFTSCFVCFYEFNFGLDPSQEVVDCVTSKRQ